MTSRQDDTERDGNRKNDTRLMTPLILMALIVVGGLLFYAYRGDEPELPVQHAAQPASSAAR